MPRNDKKVELGSPLKFRGLIYSPINEQGVVYLFSLVAEDLNIRVENIQQGYPDCTGIRYIGKGRWERIRIEFKYKSSSFDYDPEGCDIIVCWEDDLKQEKKEELAKKDVEIIELKSIIGTPEVPNKELPDPEEKSKTEYDLEENLQGVSQEVRPLFDELDEIIKNTSEEVWRKTTSTGVTYYSPEKVFIYNDFQKGGFKLTVFTRGSPLEGVEEIDYKEGGKKWGRFYVRSTDDLEELKAIVEESYDRMRKAIEKNENTGWYAEIEKEKEELS